MSGFLRPGQKRQAAFGISFDSDRDQSSATAAPYNSREHLALQDQRSRLPVHKHRKELLYLVETHATTLVVGETGSGKTTQIPQYLDEGGWTEGTEHNLSPHDCAYALQSHSPWSELAVC